MQNLQEGQTVTLTKESKSSNTYIIENIINNQVLLKHPLYPEVYIKANKDEINQVAPILKDDTERCLDYAKNYKELLDFNFTGDLDSLCLYFVVNKNLTMRQKKSLSNICGMILSTQVSNDLQEAIDLVNYNKNLLDDFNNMWYMNFEQIFNRKKHVTSPKQRSTIFNIAGFVAAQMQNPVITR